MFRLGGNMAPLNVKPTSYSEKALKLQEYMAKRDEEKKMEERQRDEDMEMLDEIVPKRPEPRLAVGQLKISELDAKIAELKDFIETKLRKIEEVVDYVHANKLGCVNQPVPTQQQQPAKPERHKRTYFELTESRYNILKGQYPELEGVPRGDLFSDGEVDYVQIGNKKVPINYKAILKLEKARKAKLPATS